MIFSARQFKFIFPRPVLVMGIVNVTPDSFSDGGKYFQDGCRGRPMLLKPLSHKVRKFWGPRRRIHPARRRASQRGRGIAPCHSCHRKTWRRKSAFQFQLILMKPAVALAALAAGASIVNDVAAGRSENAIWKAVTDFRAGYICMHAGVTGVLPSGLHDRDEGGEESQFRENILNRVGDFFPERLGKLTVAGILPEQIVFDPGIGFGKSLEQNLQLLANLRSFTTWQRPVLLGASASRSSEIYWVRRSMNACPHRSRARLWRWRPGCGSSGLTMWPKPPRPSALAEAVLARVKT